MKVEERGRIETARFRRSYGAAAFATKGLPRRSCGAAKAEATPAIEPGCKDLQTATALYAYCNSIFNSYEFPNSLILFSEYNVSVLQRRYD